MDLDLDIEARLDAEQDAAVAVMRELFAEHPDATHYVFEYLFGYEHAVLAHAKGVADRRNRVVFSGLQDVIDELAGEEDDDAISALRHDESIDQVVTEWVQVRWEEAGGRGLRCFLLRTGDSDLYDLNTQGWVSIHDVG